MVESKNVSGVNVDIDKLEDEFQRNPGEFVPLARHYLRHNLPQQAIAVCKQGLKTNPSADEGLLTLAMAYYHNFDDQRAEMELKKVLKSFPNSAIAHRTLGEIFLCRGQEKKASSALVTAFELEPRDGYTKELLKSLGEKVPATQGSNGHPEVFWAPRLNVSPSKTAKPLWHLFIQLAVVTALVVCFVVWYKHHVEINSIVREHVKKASLLIPRDNYDQLIEAENQLKAALALDNNDERTNVRLGLVQSLLWQDHDLEDRKGDLQKQLNWMEDEALPNPERFSIKALFLLDEGKTEEAEKLLTSTIERAIEQQDIFLDAMIFGVRGKIFLAEGKIADAREDFSRASRFSGDSPRYLAAFSDAYLREGYPSRAIRYFKDAKRINPSHVFTNLRLVYALIQEGKRLDEAKIILEDLLDSEGNPKDAARFSPVLLGMLFMDCAELSLALGDLAQTDQWLKKSMQVYEKSSETHNLAGRVAALNKDRVTAEKEFSRALELDPKLPKNYFDRSESLFLLGEPVVAIEKLQEFKQFIKPTVGYQVKYGELLMRTGDLERAREEFDKAIELDELNPDARFWAGMAYQKMAESIGADKAKLDEKIKLYQEAKTKYEEAISLPGGENPEVYRRMGLIYLDSEDPENALHNLATSLIMMQKNKEPTKKIASIYEDIARVYKFLGGSEGEKQEKIYLAKAQGLREGKSVEQVEKEWEDQLKQTVVKKKKHKKSK